MWTSGALGWPSPRVGYKNRMRVASGFDCLTPVEEITVDGPNTAISGLLDGS